MMDKEYLVVHDLGQLSGITIEGAGKRHPHRIECWALDDGNKVLFAKTRLGRLLNAFHVGGSFSAMAKYGLSYEELVRVMTAKIGPCDRARYLALSASRVAPRRDARPGEAFEVLGAVANFVLHVAGLGLKLLLVVVLFPFVIMFLNKHRGHR